ncbi:hypothetical protein ENBRE01_0222 [Enteropsectra breve]|nr:hypothetical protein ENBRE01_0222 [Enteropsectra breve]
MQSDFGIIKTVAVNYVWRIPKIRMLLLPTFICMMFSCYIDIHVAEIAKNMTEYLELKDDQRITREMWVYIGAIVLSTVLSQMPSLLISCAGRIAYRIANIEAYEYFLRLEPADYYGKGKAEIQNTIQRKGQAVKDIIDVFTLYIIPIMVKLIGIGYKIADILGVFQTAIIYAAIFVYCITTIKITAWRNKIRLLANKTSNMSSNILLDGLLNYETIYTTNSEGFETERYDSALGKSEKLELSLLNSLYLLNFIQCGIWALLNIVIIYVSVNGILCDKINSKNFTFWVNASIILTGGFWNLGFMYGKYREGMLNMRLTSLPSRAGCTGQDEGTTCLSSNISASGVLIKHGDKTLINDGQFEILKGEKVALVGANGCGKSTLLKTLLKINKLSGGSIKIDGADISSISEKSFSKLVAYIPQSGVLFNETVLYNICYANPELEKPELYALSQSLGIHDAIMRLDNGYDTIVGELGSKLSGGERQKVLLLRALARKAPVVVLDEATANLDSESEKLIIEKITGIQDLTAIAIVHNLELLGHFNKVLMIKEKSIRETASLSSTDIKSCFGAKPQDNL